MTVDEVSEHAICTRLAMSHCQELDKSVIYRLPIDVKLDSKMLLRLKRRLVPFHITSIKFIVAKSKNKIIYFKNAVFTVFCLKINNNPSSVVGPIQVPDCIFLSSRSEELQLKK